MKLWVWVVCGIFVGIIIGMNISDSIWEDRLRSCYDSNSLYIDTCNERVNKCMGKCDELIDSYTKMLEEGRDNCDDLIEDYQGIIEKWKDKYYDLHSNWQETLVTVENCYENSLPVCNFLVPQI
jgi:hypothetical protein